MRILRTNRIGATVLVGAALVLPTSPLRAAGPNAASSLAAPCPLPSTTPALDQRLRRLGAEPRRLALSDLDEDGIPDLIVGYADGGGGLLVVLPGNERSLFPAPPGPDDEKAARTPASHARAAWSCAGLVAAPFDPARTMIDLRVAPDFIETGDFDADGHRDVVVAARGAASILLLSGDGTGAFRPGARIPLGGRISALAGDAESPLAGRAALAAAIVSEEGPRLVIFEGAGALPNGTPSWLRLPEAGSALTFGRVGGRGRIVVSAGERLMTAEAGEPAGTHPAGAASSWRWSDDQAVGDRFVGLTSDLFLPGTGRSFQIAALTGGGRLELLRGPDLPRLGSRSRFEADGQAHDATGARGPSDVRRFESAGAVPLPGGFTTTREVTLRSLKTTMGGTGRDVLVLSGSRLALFAAKGDAAPEPIEAFRGASAMEVVDVLPLRLNPDALDDLILLQKGSAMPLVAATVPAAIFTVNTTVSAPDDHVGDGICHTVQPGTPKCSLVAAVQEANAAAGSTTIGFNLGAGTPTINGSGYTLVRPATIDGATGGATRVRILGGGIQVTWSAGGSALRSLVIEGSGGGTGVELGISDFNTIENCFVTNWQNGIHMSETDSHGNTIGGSTSAARNVISSNAGYGVAIEFDSYGNRIMGNFIGTNVTGDGAAGNDIGIYVSTDGSGNSIGGPTPVPGTPPGNVISGNGIGILGEFTSNDTQGNLIGLRADGSASLANGTGIQEYTSLSHIRDNVISGNTLDGLEEGGNAGALGGVGITGNAIGTLADGVTPAPNGRHGVLSHGTAVSVWNNVIAYNLGAGVAIDNGTGTWVSANSLHSNGGLGIDLGPLGPATNDAGDVDTGPNDLQNTPVITRARFSGGMTTIDGFLDSAPSASYKVQLFSSPVADPSGFGEGQTYLTEIALTTNASGSAPFTTTVPGNVESLSATAIRQTSPFNTSEFSAAFFNPGEASLAGTLLAARGTGTRVDLTYTPACGATNHAVYRGAAGPSTMSGVIWTGAFCGLGVAGSASFDPGTPSPGAMTYFVIVGQGPSSEGSYGRNGAGVERPEATGIGTCELGQSLTASCDP